MGVYWIRITEYTIECEICGARETVYSGDGARGRTVKNIPSAIRVAGFHTSKGKVLCNSCFKKRKELETEIKKGAR